MLSFVRRDRPTDDRIDCCDLFGNQDQLISKENISQLIPPYNFAADSSLTLMTTLPKCF